MIDDGYGCQTSRFDCVSRGTENLETSVGCVCQGLYPAVPLSPFPLLSCSVVLSHSTLSPDYGYSRPWLTARNNHQPQQRPPPSAFNRQTRPGDAHQTEAIILRCLCSTAYPRYLQDYRSVADLSIEHHTQGSRWNRHLT